MPSVATVSLWKLLPHSCRVLGERGLRRPSVEWRPPLARGYGRGSRKRTALVRKPKRPYFFAMQRQWASVVASLPGVRGPLGGDQLGLIACTCWSLYGGRETFKVASKRCTLLVQGQVPKRAKKNDGEPFPNPADAAAARTGRVRLGNNDCPRRSSGKKTRPPKLPDGRSGR